MRADARDIRDISVVIPSLNEAANLYRLLPRLREALETLNASWEILVVDGNSSDGTRTVVEKSEARYINEPRPGYGTAIMRGMTEARGEYVLTMDADMSHPTEFVQQLWGARHDADIVIASRYVAGGHADQPAFRAVLSRILNRFFARGLAMPIKDMSSGFRLYRRQVFNKLDLTFTNFVILVEVLLLAFANGAQIKEVPFHYKPRQSGSSHARIIKFGMDYLRLFYRVWRIRNSVDYPDYDERAYNSKIPLQRYWQRKRHEIIMRFTPKFVSTVDVGCGSSRIITDLPHAVGVDMRFAKLAYVRKTNKRLLQADGRKLPFPDETFDCVICSQVIEHIPNENGELIDDLTRVLKPGGTLVLGTPDYGGWQWPLIEKLYGIAAPGAYADEHVTHYTFDSLKKALEARRYESLEHDYICQAELVFKARKPLNRP